MRVLAAVPMSPYSGYGNDGIGLVQALLRKGIDVRVRPTHIDPPLPPEVAQRLTMELEPPFDLYLNHVDPLQLRQSDHNAAHATMSVGWTMWESTSLGMESDEDYQAVRENLTNFDLLLAYDPISLQAMTQVAPVEKLGVLQGGYAPEFWGPAVERDWFGDRFSFAQPLDSQVLTPTGYVDMGSLQEGDVLVDPEGGWQKVEAIWPRGEMQVYRVVFTDGTSVEATADHLWKVRQLGGEWEVRSTKDIEGDRWEVPITDAVQFEPSGDLPVDPYLLGLLLGDGSLTKAGIRFVTVDPELQDAAVSLVPEGTVGVPVQDGKYLRVSYRPTTSSVCVECGREKKLRARGLCGGCYNRVWAQGQLEEYPRMRCPSLTHYLREMGVYDLTANDKHIPEAYLRASAEARLALLQGLMDTDGTSSVCSVFSSTSQELAEGVAWLVRSLGGSASVLKYGQSGFGWRPLHVVSVRLGVNPFRLARKADRWEGHTRKRQYRRRIVSITPTRVTQVQCITVSGESSTYLTDDFVVTHNCMVGQLHDRKDPFVAIQAFQELKQEKGGAFEGAELHLHTTIPGLHPAMEQWCPKLRVHYATWPQDILKKFYQSGHVLLAPSRGEGKNVPAMEMMTTGGAVIATDFGGHSMWLSNEYAYGLDYQMSPVNGDETRYWASADKGHLKELMWHVFTHREEVKKKAEIASRTIPQMCSWDAVVDRLMLTLSKRGEKGQQVYQAYKRQVEPVSPQSTVLRTTGSPVSDQTQWGVGV